jgi:hypothetical protein
MFNRVMLASVLAILELIGVPPSEAVANHIEIGREVLLETGVSVAPHAIIRTPDGGYVIAGALHESEAWATRVDANMRVVWRHQVAHPSSLPIEGASVYEAAVALPDDTTLLCGHQA